MDSSPRLLRHGLVAACVLLATACSSSTGQDATSPTATSTSSSAATPSAGAGSSSPTSASPSASASIDTAPPASAHAVAASNPMADGVVRLQVATCAGMRTSSAFFVGSDTVLTSAQAVAGAQAIAVHSSGGVVRGEVVGADQAKGVALVRLLATGDGSRLGGHVFPMAASTPAVGSAVTALAHPVNRQLYTASGTVKAQGVSAGVDGRPVGGLFSHDAVAAPGRSGGLLVDASGKAVGVDLLAQDAGQHVAVPVAQVAAQVRSWTASPKKVAFVKCQQEGPTMTSIHPDAPAIRTALTSYLWGLSYPTQVDKATGRTGIELAWSHLGPQLRKKYGSPAGLQKAYAGRSVDAANVDNLELKDHFTDTLKWTVQWSGPGKKCQVNSDQVRLSSASGEWVVEQTTPFAATRAC